MLTVAEATDGGFKCFVGVNVKVNCLEGPACWSSMIRPPSGLLMLSFVCQMALLSGLNDLACRRLSLWDG